MFSTSATIPTHLPGASVSCPKSPTALADSASSAQPGRQWLLRPRQTSSASPSLPTLSLCHLILSSHRGSLHSQIMTSSPGLPRKHQSYLQPLMTPPVRPDAQRQGHLNTSSPNSDQPPAPPLPRWSPHTPTLQNSPTIHLAGEYQSSSLSNVLIQPINRFCQFYLLTGWGMHSLSGFRHHHSNPGTNISHLEDGNYLLFVPGPSLWSLSKIFSKQWPK